MKLLSNIIALAIPDAKPIQVAAALAIIPMYIKAGLGLLQHYRIKQMDSHDKVEMLQPCYLKLCM